MKLPKVQAPPVDPSNPPGFWERMLNATPIVMTVVATLLAGLSSSEMTAAHFHRALAAQNQSKAADQWNFFQVKRVRGSGIDNTVEILQTLSTPTPFDAQHLQTLSNLLPAGDAAQKVKASIAALLADKNALAALHAVAGEQPPAIDEKHVGDESIQAVLHAIESRLPDAQIDPISGKVKDSAMIQAFDAAYANAGAFDSAVKPINKTIDRVSQIIRLAQAIKSELSPAAQTQLTEIGRSLSQSRLRFTSRRYETDARYNMAIAQLYEVQVHRSSLESEHHRIRSKRFFYGMLGAQAAVIAASFSLAAKNRSALWLFATIAGLGAAAFGAYVYLFV